MRGSLGKPWRIWNYGTWCPYLTCMHLKLELRDLGHYVFDSVRVSGTNSRGDSGTTILLSHPCMYVRIPILVKSQTGMLMREIDIIPKEGISGLNRGEFGTTRKEAHTYMDLPPCNMGM